MELEGCNAKKMRDFRAKTGQERLQVYVSEGCSLVYPISDMLQMSDTLHQLVVLPGKVLQPKLDDKLKSLLQKSKDHLFHTGGCYF